MLWFSILAATSSQVLERMHEVRVADIDAYQQAKGRLILGCQMATPQSLQVAVGSQKWQMVLAYLSSTGTQKLVILNKKGFIFIFLMTN